MGQITLDPLLSWPWLAGLGGVALLVALLALWRAPGPGGIWRALAALALMAALANPALQSEDRSALPDIAVVIRDDTASNRIAGRAAQTAEAEAALTARLQALGVEPRVIALADDPENGGSRAMAALTSALADIPRAQLAGVIVLGDGQVHDADLAPDLPSPLHLVQTGQPDDWDRRLVLRTAPAFAIVGEPVRLGLRIEDQGAVPAAAAAGATATLAASIDGAPAQELRLPVGRDVEVSLVLPHGGQNVLELSLPVTEGELTARNNRVVVQINGVRDRLRVLLSRASRTRASASGATF